MKLLENNNLRLRALEPEDLDILYKWENDTKNWIHGNTLAPYSKLTLRNYISEVQSQDLLEAKQLRLMITLKDESSIIGTIDLFDFDIHNNRVGLGILIDENYRQNNYASETLELIENYCFIFLRIRQIYVYVSEDNANSIKLFKKRNYIQSGILQDWIYCDGKYKNVFLYQKININTHS